MLPIKSFKQYLETRDKDYLPDDKKRNGLADPDPGELKQPHKPSEKDISLAKQAVQLIMGRSAKWHRTLYRFLRKSGEKIPEVGRVVDGMDKPKNYDKLFSPQIGKNDVEPDILAPSSADTAQSFYKQ